MGVLGKKDAMRCFMPQECDAIVASKVFHACREMVLHIRCIALKSS